MLAPGSRHQGPVRPGGRSAVRSRRLLVPGLAAAAVVGYGGGRAALRAWRGHCLQWRIGWQWFALAFFLPLALMVSAAVIHVALGGALGASPVAGHLPLAAANLVLMHTAVNWWAWVVPGLLVAGGSRQFALVLGLLVLLAIGLLAWPNRRAWAARPADSKD